MSELSVYYCPRCGRFGYFQSARHAFCTACGRSMKPLKMRCPDFVRLSPPERDDLLIREILQNSSIAESPLLSSGAAGHCRLIAAMHTRILELETENRQLSGTVDWMHQTIWELLSQKQELARRLETAPGSR
ncbi:MAG: hypothetical protein Q4C73_04630 [Eubacteriales bacterium]|nr:hypothetical protein [Eubacteriales bacterium]